ncbi:alanine racemase [Cylindrospermopsis raciborskii UAM/DH-BiRr]|uniref:alanine racemase n=1 Tax=Cylindrospermopsis raciborskii TaxID=77022 RepID=UPI00387A7516
MKMLIVQDTYAWFSQRAWVEIDLGALSNNVKQLVGFLSPGSQLMAVVKADAYGHGAVTVATTVLAAGATWLGVATVTEGIQLREAGIRAPILILGATHTPEQIHAITSWQLEPTLCSPGQALIFSDLLNSIDYNYELPVHIKLDTGMSRLGADWQQAGQFAQLVQGLPRLHIASVYSHFATADSPDTTIMEQQHARFQQAIAQIRAMGIKIPSLHLANSAATLGNKELHYDMVRAGLAIYGLYPAAHQRNHLQLRPALQVKARITHIKTISEGTGVSYGHKFIAPREMRIGVVGIGYADGVPRSLSSQMDVLVQGQRVKQIGMITMDQLMIDISSLVEVEEGEIVTLLGEQGEENITADDWANQLNTISWEIICGFKHRLPRVAIGIDGEI